MGHYPPIRSLILLGGQSSRMGSPKHLLPIPSDISLIGCEAPLLLQTILVHHIFQVKHGDPLIRTVTLSVRDDVQRQEVKDLLKDFEDELPTDLTISYVQDGQEDSGPAAGLAAAWRLDRHAHWLVNACDYPLLTKSALEQLRTNHHQGQKAVTCFVNSQGQSEPLLGLWTGAALQKTSELLEEQGDIVFSALLNLLEQGNSGGDSAQKPFTQGLMAVTPQDEKWITTVETQADWSEVKETIEDEFPQSKP